MRIITCLLFILFLSCQFDNGSNKHTSKIHIAIEGSSHVQDKKVSIFYVDDLQIPCRLDIGFGSVASINTKRKWVDIEILADNRKFGFLLNGGDSLMISFVQNKPRLTSLIRQSSDANLNFEQRVVEEIYPAKMKDIDDYFEYWQIANWDNRGWDDPSLYSNLVKLKSKAQDGLLQENVFIDSLLITGEIDEPIARYFSLKNSFYHDWLNFYRPDTLIFEQAEHIKSLFELLNDTLTFGNNSQYFTFANRILEQVSFEFNQFESEFTPVVWAEKIQMMVLDKIIQEQSVSASLELVQKLNKTERQLGWQKHLIEKHHLNGNFGRNLMVVNRRGKSEPIEDVLMTSLGKYVYLDIWASWCTPCLREFTELRELEKELGDSVDFYYVSIDQSKTQWINADSHWLRTQTQNSFLVDEIRSFMTEYNISEIPRGILLGKYGELLHPNLRKEDLIRLINESTN